MIDVLKLFKRKQKKCSCCKEHEARGYIFGKALCTNCILEARQYFNVIIEAIKEDNWRMNDKREVEDIERRYTKGIAVKGSD